ncbi:MAG TPA: AAA family ATPase [Solirubrobacteraceae bacterium]|jgi:DNA-binding CsgD family transcriptional regulator|nr:AAA family ATPase [Solirubrobacteraceae bacterium]
MVRNAPALLYGRNKECARLDGLLKHARTSDGGALVLRGEAGVGKTELTEYAIGSAASSGINVVRISGIESEMELAFAGLQQMCAPLADLWERVPKPQLEALQIAFGRRSGTVPDQFLVGLAVVSLLSAAGREEPLLCVVDDAQWLDRASALTLGFVARRLALESVVMLFAARDPPDWLADAPELLVEGLARRDARALLAAMVPGPLDERVAEQVVAEAQGNPLALLELSRGLDARELAGGFGLPGSASLSASVERVFLSRIEALPEDTRRLLLLAAADPTGDPSLLWRAATRLGLEAHALGPARSDGLIETDRTVRLRHPLLRRTIYRAATAPMRREAHLALGGATDEATDPDRHAWHLGLAAADPDEAIAAKLERAATRAQARGGLAAAAAFHERAVGLTPDPAVRGRRALTAAQRKYEAGALADAASLLDIADAAAPAEDQRARLELLRAQLKFALDRGSEAPALLLSAAHNLEQFDPDLARATYLDALMSARFAGPIADHDHAVIVANAVLSRPSQPEPPRPTDLLLEGLAVQITEGYAAGAPLLKAALTAFHPKDSPSPGQGRWLSLALWAAADLWEDEIWRRLTTEAVERARKLGALTGLSFAVSMLSYVHAMSGELVPAEELLDEIRMSDEATGAPSQPYLTIWIASLRGREAEMLDLIRTASDDAAERGEGYATFVVQHATAVLCNSLGRYGEATEALRGQALNPSLSDGSPRPMAELVEAAVRSGDSGLAARALDRLVETTGAAGTDWALGVEARSRALVADGDDADGLYREAIERLGRTSIRIQLARSHLIYGEWLLRERRRPQAREQLRVAFEMFTTMGADGFAMRSRRALRGIGARPPKRSMETGDGLTARELQISHLAARGDTNKEIAAELFVSTSTVEYHLSKVFEKLGVASRYEIGAVLRGDSNA